MKIGVMGTHGAGKTTLVNSIAAAYGPDATVLQEGVRHCPFRINRFMSLNSQRWILARQVAMEHYAEGDELVICDRTVIDPMVYTIWLLKSTNNPAIADFLNVHMPFALDWYHSYDTVIWCRPDRARLAADGVRDTDPEFQEEIDCIFEWVVNSHCLAWVPPESFAYLKKIDGVVYGGGTY